MKRLLIRADANSEMGTGHVMRCLALAQEWIKRGGEVICVTAPGAPGMVTRMEAERIRVIGLDAEAGGAADAAVTTGLAQENEADWVVLDGYHFDGEYQRAVKQKGLRLLCLDDAGQIEHYWADVVLNQNFGANAGQYASCESYTRLCLGPQYTLLRSEFLVWQNWARVVPARGINVLVTFGGSDPDNLTTRVVRVLRAAGGDGLNVTVVIGASNAHYDEVMKVAQVPGAPIRVESNVQDTSRLMAETDIAVILAGVTLAESLFMGCAIISYAHSKVQAQILRELDKKGVISYLGFDREFEATELVKKIRWMADLFAVREKLARQGRSLVDGNGVARVLEVLAA